MLCFVLINSKIHMLCFVLINSKIHMLCFVLINRKIHMCFVLINSIIHMLCFVPINSIIHMLCFVLINSIIHMLCFVLINSIILNLSRVWISLWAHKNVILTLSVLSLLEALSTSMRDPSQWVSLSAVPCSVKSGHFRSCMCASSHCSHFRNDAPHLQDTEWVRDPTWQQSRISPSPACHIKQRSSLPTAAALQIMPPICRMQNEWEIQHGSSQESLLALHVTSHTGLPYQLQPHYRSCPPSAGHRMSERSNMAAVRNLS